MLAAIAINEVGKNALPSAAIKGILAYKQQVKIGLFESCHPKRKDHLAEKGDTARHGNNQEAERKEGPVPDENQRPA